MNKDIYLTNSFGNKKIKFIPINKDKINMYVCGPTVYDDPHIGNARPLIVFDILFRVLKCRYGDKKVTYVRNITDIDDKIIQSSIDKKISTDELTRQITKNFHEDCLYLNCQSPNFEPKAKMTVGSDWSFIFFLRRFTKTPAIISFSKPSFSIIDARIMASINEE